MNEKRTTIEDPLKYDQFTARNPYLQKINEEIVEFIAGLQMRTGKGKLVVFDVGAGTGQLSIAIAKKLSDVRVFAFENDNVFYNQLEINTKQFLNIRTAKEDIVSYQSKYKADIITSRLTYHHIPDNQKLTFLQNSHENLVDGGCLIVAEECLRDYSNETERKMRDREYHRYRIFLAEQEGDSEYIAYQKNVFQKNLCPYKVSIPVLCSQLEVSGFTSITVSQIRSADSGVDYDLLGYNIVFAKKNE